MENTRGAIVGMERLLWGIFLPRLLSGKYKYVTPLIVSLSMIPVKNARMGLHNPVMSADKTFLGPKCAGTKLILVVTGEGDFH